jgi:hypothetical protein
MLHFSNSLEEEIWYMRVFENRVLRRILESKREEETTSWGHLHSEEFHNLYQITLFFFWSRS